MSKIAIIDCKLGNLFSVEQMCREVGLESEVVEEAIAAPDYSALILPGVGAFGPAIKNLKESDLDEAVIDFAREGKPVLGICLGMQLLTSGSSEFGSWDGLGLVEGRVSRFSNDMSKSYSEGMLKVPKVGWNRVNVSQTSAAHSLFDASLEDEYFYFVHSYFVEDVPEAYVTSWTDYGSQSYVSSFCKGNVTGFQFHPEKSGQVGAQLFSNWVKNSKLKPKF